MLVHFYQLWSETNLVENQQSFRLYCDKWSLEDIAQTCSILCFILIIEIILEMSFFVASFIYIIYHISCVMHFAVVLQTVI